MAPAVIPIAQLVALRDDKGLARIHDLNSWQSTLVSEGRPSHHVCLSMYIQNISILYNIYIYIFEYIYI